MPCAPRTHILHAQAPAQQTSKEEALGRREGLPSWWCQPHRNQKECPPNGWADRPHQWEFHEADPRCESETPSTTTAADPSWTNWPPLKHHPSIVAMTCQQAAHIIFQQLTGAAAALHCPRAWSARPRRAKPSCAKRAMQVDECKALQRISRKSGTCGSKWICPCMMGHQMHLICRADDTSNFQVSI